MAKCIAASHHAKQCDVSKRHKYRYSRGLGSPVRGAHLLSDPIRLGDSFRLATMLPIRLSSLLAVLAMALAQTTPACTDGGTLYCCQATFAGHNALVVAAVDLACYDLTPADVNCIISMTCNP